MSLIKVRRMLIGIVSMLINFVIPIPCKAATDQTWWDELSVATKPAYPYEYRHSLRARSRRDTLGMNLPRILMPSVQQNTSYNLSNLTNMCPYADLCDRQGREILSKSRVSCCLPCSCDPNCKKIGNCCDKRETTGYMCHSPLLRKSEMNQTARDGYFMVDECLNGSEIDCKTEKPAAWGPLYPVYDSILKLNFYNPQCAECSGAKDYKNWGLNVVCQGTNVNDRYFLNVLRGKVTEECYIEFTPPKKMTKMNHLCSSRLISRCNATGRWKTYNSRLEEACSRWYSPVVSKWWGFLEYANVYCQQCNEHTSMDPEDLCSPVTIEKSTIGESFALAIDYRRVAELADKRFAYIDKPNRHGVCREGTVKHISIEQTECRTLLCPNGFIRSEKECLPLLLNSLNDGYNVQLLLTPTSDELLPLSYLETLTAEQKQEPTTWFKSQGAPLDHFEVVVKNVTIEKTLYVENLIVRLGKIKNPVSLSKEIKLLKEAMKKSWVIALNGTVFEFTVRFYRYAWFLPLMSWGRTDVLMDLTNNKTTESVRYVQSEEAYGEIGLMGTIPATTLFTIKKTNFCNRVRLVRSEWIAGFQEIRLNTSEAVLDSNKTLGDSEFDIFLGDQGEPTVEICVDDFNPEYQKQIATGTATFLLASWLMVFIQLGVLIDISNLARV